MKRLQLWTIKTMMMTISLSRKQQLATRLLVILRTRIVRRKKMIKMTRWR